MKPEDRKDKPNDQNDKWSIHIDKKEYFAQKNPMTGTELKALAGITGDFDIFKIVPGHGDDVKIGDEEPVHLKNGDHFYSVPRTLNPGGGNAAA